MTEKKVFQPVIYNRIKKALKKAFGITALNEQILAINTQLRILQEILFGEDIRKRSKIRWQESEPEKSLTWGKKISGDNFIKKLQNHAPFNKKTQILEIGPGYGRMLNSLLGVKLDFKKYVGLDISEKNINYLRSTYANKSIEFILGDAEIFSFNEKFDVVFSSLTFKHMFPTFENALKNLAGCMEPGGIIVFDLLEGDKHEFENDLVTFLRGYSKEKVIEILKKIPLEFVAFDQVEHEPGYMRLLVVAKKAGTGD